MAKIIFMGTPEFAVPSLQALIATQEVVGVVTQPDRPAGRGRKTRYSPVKEIALAAGLPLYQPPSLRQPEKAAPLHDWQPDAVVVAAFGQILRPHVLDLPPLGCINVHASLLPRWRGAAPIQYAIQAGDTETGITLMKMDVGLDTGPLYVQEAVPITGTDTAATLHDRLALLGGEMLRRHLDGILTSRIPPQPQDDNQATYAPLIKKEAGEIDWSADSAAIDRHIRAMTPWPSAFTTWAGTQLKIFPATPLAHSPAGAEPGRVIADGEGILVAAGKGCLQIHTVQLSGRKALPVEEFINGHPHFAGSRLS